MPSHPKSKDASKLSQDKGPKGVLKRLDDDSRWSSIGTAIDVIPSQLPTIRTILRRYRSLRIAYKRDPIISLAKIIFDEVILLWTKARVPTTSERNCKRRVTEVIEFFNSIHNKEDFEKPEVVAKMNSLFDLKPKLKGKPTEEAELENLRNIMRQTSERKRKRENEILYDWETDYNFYIDQFKGPRVQTLGSADVKLNSELRDKQKRLEKRITFYDTHRLEPTPLDSEDVLHESAFEIKDRSDDDIDEVGTVGPPIWLT